MIRRAALRSGKSKSAFILECVYEKLGLTDRRSQIVRQLAGWMPHSEAEELRQATEVFNTARVLACTYLERARVAPGDPGGKALGSQSVAVVLV